MAPGSRRAKSKLNLTPVLTRLTIHPHMSGCLEGTARPRVQGVGVAGLTEAGLSTSSHLREMGISIFPTALCVCV